MGKPLVHCFYTLPLRGQTIVKLLLTLKKHALQDDRKVLGFYWITFDNCGKKQSKINALICLFWVDYLWT